MSVITISDLTTSESFISEISEVETGALVGGDSIPTILISGNSIDTLNAVAAVKSHVSIKTVNKYGFFI